MNYAGRGINSLENWEVKKYTLTYYQTKKKSAALFSDTLNHQAVGVVAVTVSISKQRFIKPSILAIFKQNIFTIKIIKRD